MIDSSKAPTGTGVTSYAMPNDTQVVVTRIVNAPRQVVFEAFTVPSIVQQWLLGPDGWSMPICEIDLRVGGPWRYVYRRDTGSEMTLSGVYREIVPPERVVWTETWGPEWPETLNELRLVEREGQTTITMTITFASKEGRDAAMQTGAMSGLDKTFDRLHALLLARRSTAARPGKDRAGRAVRKS